MIQTLRHTTCGQTAVLQGGRKLSTNTRSRNTAAQFELAQPPSDAVSSIAFAPGSSSRIIASSWDKNVYVYSIDGERSEDGVQGSLIRTIEHRAPVMAVCFGATDSEAYSAGMDWQVSRVDLETGEISSLSKHTAPVRQVVYSREHCTSSYCRARTE